MYSLLSRPRACRNLGWVAVAMLVVGLWVQWLLARKLPKSAPSAGASGDDAEDGSRTFSAPPEFRTPIEKRVNGADTAGPNGSEESQGAVGQLGRGQIDGNVQRPKTHGSRACRSTFPGLKRSVGVQAIILKQKGSRGGSGFFPNKRILFIGSTMSSFTKNLVCLRGKSHSLASTMSILPFKKCNETSLLKNAMKRSQTWHFNSLH